MVPITNSATQLIAMVMPDTSSGKAVVTTGTGSFTSSTNFSVTATGVPAAQQGAKLVGTGNTGAASQGRGVAISADGNTMVAGGYADNASQGAAWVFTRSGGVWSQEGAKLVGTGNAGAASQGHAVAISADGNTIAVGGYGDILPGAVWIYTRTGGVWSQQGAKLVGTGSVGGSQQGGSVALSADGNTLLVGGAGDNGNLGAAWIFTRSGGVWTQQGAKLVGTGNVGNSQQGQSVALSADGNTAIVSGPLDNTDEGAAWIFTQSGGVWTQQGAKLVGTGNTGAARQGRSVALSADGNTAILGGYWDNGTIGAAWVFTRSGGVWTQQGAKITASDAVGAAQQGSAVSLSADGNTALIGGFDDGAGGAAWVYTRAGAVWTQQGTKLPATGGTGADRRGYSVSLSSDGFTAAVGGFADNGTEGASWIFVP